MIVVRVELWPDGDSSLAEVLGMATIENDNTGTPEAGNYTCLLSGRHMKRLGCERLTSFPRTGLVWDLLGQFLKKMRGDQW